MPRAFVCVLLAALVGCGRVGPTSVPTSEPGPAGCKLAGDWEGEFVITQADGVALPPAMQLRLPAQLRISPAGTVTMTVTGTTVRYEHAGQFITGNPFGHAHVALEVTKLDVGPEKIVLETMSQSATVQRAAGDKPLNKAEQASEMVFTLAGEGIQAQSVGHTTKPNTGVRSTVVMGGAFRRVGAAPAAPSGASPQSPAGPASDEYLPLKVGTAWRYRHKGAVVTSNLTAEEDIAGVRAVRMEMSAGGRPVSHEYLFRRPDGYYRAAINGTPLGAPVRTFRLPPKDGDTWSIEVKVGPASAAGEATVSAESVTVPAGQYDAFKVRSVVREGANAVTADLWYARGVGIVKQRVQADGEDLVFELERFEPAR